MGKGSAKNPPRPAQIRRRAPSQERSVEMVRRLLDATAQVLSEVGLAKLSTNKVARRANVAVGSIYQYFPNKEALIDALVEDRMQRLGQLVSTRMAALGSASFPAAAEAMLRAVVDFLAREPGLVPVLLGHALAEQDTGVAGRLRTEGEVAARAFLEGLGDLAVPDLDVAVFVSTNVAGFFGALLASPSMQDDRRERVIAQLVRMLSLWIGQGP
jgi:AcrR family transcriptional regulator